MSLFVTPGANLFRNFLKVDMVLNIFGSIAFTAMETLIFRAKKFIKIDIRKSHQSNLR